MIVLGHEDVQRGLVGARLIEGLADGRFATTAGRYAHHDELDRILTEWTSGQDLMTAFHTLQGAGVTAGPQFDEEMLARDPHVAARGWIRELDSRDVGSYPHISYAFQGVPQVWARAGMTILLYRHTALASVRRLAESN